MDKSERLQQFLSWAGEEASIAAERLATMRGVAVELIEQARGGRVMESHILAVSDRMGSAGGPEAETLVTECGELFLRFEDALRSAGTPVPRVATRLPQSPGPRRPKAPPGERTPAPSPAFQPTVPAPSTPPSQPRLPPMAESSVAEAPSDVASLLRPPERQSTGSVTSNDPPPVTFKSSGVIPSEITPTPPPPAPPPPPTQLAVPSGPSPQPPRPSKVQKSAKPGRSAASFRCPNCHVMVSANAEGKCPKCGASPPHAIDLPREELPLPGAVQSSGLPGWIPYGIGALVVLLVGLVIYKVVGTRDRGKGASVAGEATLADLDVKATFPAGWHRLAGSQQKQNVLGTAAHMASFYRGERSSDPEVTVDLVVIEGRLVPPEAGEIIPDSQFQDLLENVSGALVTLTRTSAEIDAENCKIVVIAMRRTGRCTAPAGPDGARQVAVYYWLMGERTGAALFESEGELLPLLHEADDIVGTIESTAAAAEDEAEPEGEAPAPAESEVDAAP